MLNKNLVVLIEFIPNRNIPQDVKSQINKTQTKKYARDNIKNRFHINAIKYTHRYLVILLK